MKAPCYNCEDRCASCASGCEAYKAHRIYNLAQAAERQKKRMTLDYQIKQKAKSRRK